MATSNINKLTLKRTIFIALIALAIVAAVQVEPIEAGDKSDLIFVKGKFIKKSKKGVIVVEEKSHCGCHGRRR